MDLPTVCGYLRGDGKLIPVGIAHGDPSPGECTIRIGLLTDLTTLFVTRTGFYMHRGFITLIAAHR